MSVATDAFIGLDTVGKIRAWSPRAREMFGIPEAGAINSLFDEILLAPESVDGYRSGLLHLERTGATEEARIRRRVTAQRYDGHQFAAELHLGSVEVNGARFVACFVRDISETMLAEQQLLQAQKLEAIGQLTGSLAHDFNNILSIIIGSLDLIEPAAKNTVERELLAAALSGARRGAEITRALLAVARRRPIMPQACDVNQQVDEVAPLLRQSAGKKSEGTARIQSAPGHGTSIQILLPAMAEMPYTP